MTKDYTDFLKSAIEYSNEYMIDNQESSDEFYGCPDYKSYYEEWC